MYLHYCCSSCSAYLPQHRGSRSRASAKWEGSPALARQPYSMGLGYWCADCFVVGRPPPVWTGLRGGRIHMRVAPIHLSRVLL